MSDPRDEPLDYFAMKEDFDNTIDQKIDDVKEVMAHELRAELVSDLQYRAYRWQRTFYGIAADRLAAHFPRADKYEAMLQDELQRAA